MDGVITRWVERIQVKLDELLPKKPNEEEFRQAIHPLLAAFCAEFGVRAEISDGYTLSTGRNDSAFNRVVVGYPHPGYLSLNFTRATDYAIGDFLGYLHRLAEDETSGIRRLAGALFDGRCIVFVQCIDGDWREDYIAEVDRGTLERLLIMLLGTAPGGDR
ncbi:MAG TPA: hypothetical protein VM054_05435 [bacterium]|nr:hypothetical protein [bacterium]